MKWDCDSRKIKRQIKWKKLYSERIKWKRWFAWYPVKVAPHDCRWLEYVYYHYDYYWIRVFESKDYNPIFSYVDYSSNPDKII